MEELAQTEFNSNLATLMRIDNALKVCANASVNDEFLLWFKSLSILKREVIVKMKDEEHKEYCIKKFNTLEKRLKVYLKSKAKHKDSLHTSIDNELDNVEIYLREIMNAKGMLLKDTESGMSKFRKG